MKTPNNANCLNPITVKSSETGGNGLQIIFEQSVPPAVMVRSVSSVFIVRLKEILIKPILSSGTKKLSV